METNYALYYTEANVVSIIIFTILLVRNAGGIDKQLKQNVFNKVLLCHILYFISDIFWELELSGYIERTLIRVLIPNLANAVLLYCLTYYWYYYVEISEGSTYLLDKRNVFVTQIPGNITTVLLFYFAIFNPRVLVDESLNITNVYLNLFVIAPEIYVIVSAIRSIYRAFKKENYAFKTQYFLLGLYPLLLLVFGIAQILVINLPLFCFGCTILMTYVYISSLDNLVSLDPLTGLNNRAQLKRYLANISAHNETNNNDYYLMMMDLDRFKYVNDHFGHAEGDKAIVKTADAIKRACSSIELRPFISRYGGDEFLIIVKTNNEDNVKMLKESIESALNLETSSSSTPYELRASIGYSKYDGQIANFQEAINEADEALYIEKELHHCMN